MGWQQPPIPDESPPPPSPALLPSTVVPSPDLRSPQPTPLINLPFSSLYIFSLNLHHQNRVQTIFDTIWIQVLGWAHLRGRRGELVLADRHFHHSSPASMKAPAGKFIKTSRKPQLAGFSSTSNYFTFLVHVHRHEEQGSAKTTLTLNKMFLFSKGLHSIVIPLLSPPLPLSIIHTGWMVA